MNQSERVAYAWLRNKGFQEDDITFRSNGTPGFLTSTGAGYEVKLLYGKAIRFTSDQVDRLLQHEDAKVLVVQGSEVIHELATAALKGKPRQVGELSISYMEGYATVRLDKDVVDRLRDAGKQIQGFGFNNLPEELQGFFVDGVSDSAVLAAALYQLEQIWGPDVRGEI